MTARSFGLAACSLLSASLASAQPADRPGATRTGAQIFDSACAACHGRDGRGANRSLVGFDTRLPDFTDCAFVTPEPDTDWLAVVHEGGPARGFNRRMPAFGEALSEDEIRLVVAHVRTFCTDRAWPRGDLNLPRPLVTEKAFPENEFVWTTSITNDPSQAVEQEFIYEHRLGRRGQFELGVPLANQEVSPSGSRFGLGDVAFALKHAFFHDLDAGRIFSAGTEIRFPTGKENEGLGGGVTIFEPFVAFGQMLPSDGFVQLQVGVELPTDRGKASNEVFWRAAMGKSFTQGRFGRAWTPMIEFLGAQETSGDEPALWDLVPEMQVTLSRRQHIMVNAGVRVPLNEREGRGASLLAYFLWDWFDGGLLEGWR